MYTLKYLAMTKHATPFIPVRNMGLLLICLLIGISPILGQEFESNSPNGTSSTGQLISTFPNQLNGNITGSDIDFWSIPDGTSGNFQVLDLSNLNFLFGSLDLELHEFSDANRTSLNGVQVLEETDVFTLNSGSFYSLRVAGNSTPSVTIPSSITTYSELLGLVGNVELEFLNFVSAFGSTALTDIAETIFSIIKSVVQFFATLGLDLPSGISSTINNIVSNNSGVDIYGVAIVTSTAGAGGSSAAPVVWVDFSAEISGAGVELSWTTASEENNAGFSIEYSPDAENWESLDFVAGMGSTTEMTAYTYLHSTPALGYNYYRLKQTDFNGDFEYSPIREVVQQGAVTTSAFNVFPNPTVDVLNVSPLIGSITLRDLQGRTLHQSQAGGSWTQLDISSYPSGIYILQLQTSEGILQSFNIQKN